jgi:glyoxylase-like metal-dependent hydrolase (beta-lactamase superfamily II)
LPLLTTIPVGGLQTNCYILAAEGSDECAVIDPGAEPQKIIAALQQAKLRLRYILCTHGHADHTGGVRLLHDTLGGQFYLHRSDLGYSTRPPGWLVMALGGFAEPPEPDDALQDLAKLALGGGEIALIRTPGHTPGSTCFRYGEMVFTGDTLFRESIGRYDLPGGNGAQELASIRERLLVLDDSVKVFPGHGPSSTIGHERRHNPYLADLR